VTDPLSPWRYSAQACGRSTTVAQRELERAQRYGHPLALAFVDVRGLKSVNDTRGHLAGDKLGIEGSWSGNDTIWRTGLDLNRILLYGEIDGGMAATPRRRVVHIVDAIVAGQGDGPLSPLPLPLGLLFAGDNAACVDWFGAQLLGYDPQLIAIVREAFGSFNWPIATCRPEEISVSGDWGTGKTSDVIKEEKLPEVIHPVGWRDAARPPLVEENA